MTTINPPFVMPRFSRTIWVSDRARQEWEPKITAFAQAWRQIEWLTVIDNLRPCASFWISQLELASLAPRLAAHGLKASPLLWRSQTTKTERTLLYRVAVGNSKNLRHFRKAWKRADDDAIGALLGYPPCCRAFFRKHFVDAGLTSNIWPMATQSSSTAPENRLIEVTGPPELNPFWLQSAVCLTPHYPCHFNCAPSLTLAQAFCESARKSGFSEAIDTALEIFRWPVEWSCLHGIAEIRTPILKTTTNTDATNFKQVIKYAGSAFPQDGARGLSFALKPLGRNSLKVLT